MHSNVQTVFKVAPRAAWERACETGAFTGSDADRADGFIHLSALHQLRGTLQKHYAGQPDLLLVAFDAGALGNALKWEPSRGGDLFPHLYAELPTHEALSVHPLTLDADGIPVVPEEVGQC
jgi:uncharacterized protein (DUF952 family)